MMSDRLLKVKDVAERLNVSRAYVYELIKIKKLQAVEIQGKGKRLTYRILESEVAKIIQASH